MKGVYQTASKMIYSLDYGVSNLLWLVYCDMCSVYIGGEIREYVSPSFSGFEETGSMRDARNVRFAAVAGMVI